MEFFFTLLPQTFVVRFHDLHIALLVVIVICCVGWRTHQERRLRPLDVVRAAGLLLLPVSLLLWGSFHRFTPSEVLWSPSALRGLNVIADAAVIVLVGNVWLSKGRRGFMIAWSMLILYWVGMAWVVAEFAITGDCLAQGRVLPAESLDIISTMAGC